MKTNPVPKAILFLLLFNSIPGFSQTPTSRNNPADDPSLDLYKDYEAVIIEDYGKIHFLQTDVGFEFVFERKVRFKINTSSGLRWAEVEIPVYHEGDRIETLTGLDATVFDTVGRLAVHLGLKDLDVYEEKYDENTTLKKIAVPGVTEGSVMELNYSIQSPFLFHLRDWVFQYTIPVIKSNFEFCVIPFYEYNFLIRGTNTLNSNYFVDSQKEKSIRGVLYRERTYYFSLLNIPAFEDESFITSRRDYIIRLEFQLCRINRLSGAKIDVMEDWPAVCKELLDYRDFGKYLSAARTQSKKQVGEMAIGGKAKEEVVDMIVDYVKHNFKWNSDNRKFASKKFRDLLKVKEGNSADLNLGLIGMLNAAGIEAYPLIISTREHGKIYRDSPLHTHFNYVIAYIPDGDSYLLRDATDLAYPVNRLPVKCINKEGLLVIKNSEKWINLNVDTLYSMISVQIECNPIPEEHKTRCSFQIASTGYDAIRFRKMAGNDPKEVLKFFENNLISEEDSIMLISGETPGDSFNLRIKGPLPLDEAGNLLLIHPFENFTELKNPFIQKERTYPVDMIYLRERNYHTEILIPDGYRINHLPGEYVVDNDLISINYIPELVGENWIVIDADVRFKKRIYPSRDYRRLRAFYNEIVERFNEKVVLEHEVNGTP